MKRKHKKYSGPKRPYEKARIEEEAKIKEEFGLKNKKEIWKADSKVKSIREKARKLISSGADKQNALFRGLKKIGLNVNSITDVLSLNKEDYLKRRLQTVLLSKKLASTPRGARQLVTHKKVLVDGKVVNIPSYIVPAELEGKITLKRKAKEKSSKEKEMEEKIESDSVQEEAMETKEINAEEN